MKKLLMVGVLVSAMILSACTSEQKVVKEGLERVVVAGSYSIDVDDLSQIVGDADYVFVADIKSEIDTEYRRKITKETANGPVHISTPYTKYSVSVVENIKGELITDSEIELVKFGGVTEDKKSVVVLEHDELPQVGNSYIIAVYAQPDGSLLVSGENSNLPLSETTKTALRYTAW